MRFVKAFLAGATGLFIIITLISLLIPARVQVVRTVIINNVAPAIVLQQVADVNNWKNWHPVFTLDSAVVKPSVAVGALKKYTILHRQKESTIILQNADSSSIDFLLQAAGENDMSNQVTAIALPNQAGAQVSWKAVTQLHWYPWDKFYAIFIDKLTGPGYDQALNGLKEFLEKASAR